MAPTEKRAPSRSQSEVVKVGVYARFRPVDAGKKEGSIHVLDGARQVIIKAHAPGVNEQAEAKNLEFGLNRFFETFETQQAVYDEFARARVESVILRGHNSTLMAYGQTGSGKTYSMFGPEEVLSNLSGCDPALLGVVPRALGQIFEPVDGSSTQVTVSFIELYLDRLHDLLVPAVRKSNDSHVVHVPKLH